MKECATRRPRTCQTPEIRPEQIGELSKDSNNPLAELPFTSQEMAMLHGFAQGMRALQGNEDPIHTEVGAALREYIEEQEHRTRRRRAVRRAKPDDFIPADNHNW